MIERKSGLYIGLSFLAGVLMTLGFKDVYPDLERRFWQRRRRFSIFRGRGGMQRLAPQVTLEDHENDEIPFPFNVIPEPEIAQGIEACIGNTPLFRIKSLSDATGCEILAKAEVFPPTI